MRCFPRVYKISQGKRIRILPGNRFFGITTFIMEREIGAIKLGKRLPLKINMNNCYRPPYCPQECYEHVDDQIDASPYVIKSLLRQLVDIVGVKQSDITIYDASRPIPDWFYNRVIYRDYPETLFISEFPDVQFRDKFCLAPGRLQVQESCEKIYFSSQSHISRTLPTCVSESDYLINMPLLKRHNLGGVTLSGKNLFGTWIESVDILHSYLRSGLVMGNPAPQTDLLAHECLGGKTILYVGDGLFGTTRNHIDIDRYQMYPFNDDWPNSLFFSQDPVALDSVMFDFIQAECIDICEGSQNYLHQAAEPPSGVYDPENDGIYLNVSLGVHKHWDNSFDIFSSQRYSGPGNKGIDFIPIGQKYATPTLFILTPRENYLYIASQEIIPFPINLIIGKIDVHAEVIGLIGEVEKVEFKVDGILKYTGYSSPYIWNWDEAIIGMHTLTVTGVNTSKQGISREKNVVIFNL